MSSIFKCADKSLDLSATQVMGVLNVTPDSFSDGGKFNRLDDALRQAEKMLSNGATIIDVGGESTRPGALPVSIQEEMERVLPVVARIKSALDVVISVDTSSPQLMDAAIEAGAHMINDVRAFSRPGAVEVVKEADVALCVMHMQGSPEMMQANPNYISVYNEVKAYLQTRLERLVAGGVSASRLMIDPGFGFGKTLQHNLELLDAISKFVDLGYPVLVGMSRKTMIGEITGKPVEDRLMASVSAAVVAALKGAAIVRVHDVEETVDALKVVNALRSVSPSH